MKEDNCKKLNTLLINIENKYMSHIQSKFGIGYLSKKTDQMNKLIQTLDKDLITEKEFESLRRISISKGGFVLNVYRNEFYKKIFCLKYDKCIIIMERCCIDTNEMKSNY